MKKLLSVAVALFFTVAAFAQIETPVKWAYAAKKISATEAVVFVKATIDEGWHVYSQHVKEDGPSATVITFAPSSTYTLIGKPAEPKPITKFEKSFGMNVGYFEKSVVFQQKVKLKSPGQTTVKGKVEFMTCNDHKCLPPDDVEFAVAVK
ncbi:protein-disulfide reductase DsbD N-terminal domain-containing protein [Mucilaginibacter lacusdianchii]|uniref:protein-disulfide reductase DsbD N-terminal domain-containing protein n=1 Tax=Mucilaginibacter lacusdianchii TaxID=2684211 RepID=UPI00131E668B|nr:protein-disulfide reductase DsbD N-terminal domain-containing protein [Mucilaginibacter sp. JXJ CY 39]